MTTTVSTTLVGYRLNLTLGASTTPTSTQVSAYITEAENTVEEIEPDATQNAKDVIIMKLVLKACEYEMKWQHNQGAESAGDDKTGSFQYGASYLDWITKKDLEFLRKSAARQTQESSVVLGSMRS